MEAKTSMTAHFIYVMPIQSLYVCITVHNTVQCTVMGEEGINFSITIKRVKGGKEHPSYNKTNSYLEWLHFA